MTRANLKDLQRAGATTVSAKGGFKSMKEFFEANKQAINEVLPSVLTAERLLRLAYGAVRTTPKLQECTVESLFGAVIQAAQFGLEPSTPLGECYLIPYRNFREKRTDCQFQLGYKGVIKLARRSGQILDFTAMEVCANDVFEYGYGNDHYLRHVPPNRFQDRGQVEGYYSYAHLKGEGFEFRVMSLAEVNAIRDKSQNWIGAHKWAGKPGIGKPTEIKWTTPWHDHPVWMGRKTLFKQLGKTLPLSIEDMRALDADEKVITGMDPNAIDAEFDVVVPAAASAKGSDQQALPEPERTVIPGGNPAPAEKVAVQRGGETAAKQMPDMT